MYEDTIAYFAIVDFRRPSSLKDYPYLIGIEDENEFGSENFIKALVISNDKIDSYNKECILNIIEGMIGSKESCDWNLNFELTSLELSSSSLDEIYNEIKNILISKFNHKLDIDSIGSLNLNYLLQ